MEGIEVTNNPVLYSHDQQFQACAVHACSMRSQTTQAASGGLQLELRTDMAHNQHASGAYLCSCTEPCKELYAPRAFPQIKVTCSTLPSAQASAFTVGTCCDMATACVYCSVFCTPS
jgi:hypothetical protein